MNSSVIQSHLYNVFLTGQTSDISIRITGAFNATYKLHRVVLIQAGFWRDLFTGGFIESSGRRHTGINSDAKIAITSSGEEILDVILNDRNISRAAFELSISRLYGGGPPLYIHPSLVPTSTHPLTFGFPYTSALPLSSSILYPPGYQPATPAFLLSLLATSIYFSIPSLASEALTGILRTIGPRTIGYYLSFALGRAKLERADLSAVGLDGLAKDLEERKHEPETSGMVTSATHSAEIHSGEMHHEQYSPLTTDFPSSPSSLSSTSDGSLYIPFAHTTTTRNPHLPRVTELSSTQFYYGSISDKIGEACACWLARWGADIFAEEEKVDGMEALPLSSDTTDATRFGLPTTSPWSAKWSQSNIKSIPRLFTATAVGAEHTGLSLSWIHALISSDDFFVPAPSLYAPEEERYTFTKRVVELRRAVRTKCREEDEQWDVFFRTSIYYANLSSEAVISISKDISPSTGRPYVKLRTLQEAAWEAGIMKSTITNNPPSLNIYPINKLGFAKTASDTLLALAADNSVDNAKPYFTIPFDESLRIGDTITTTSADERSEPEKIAPIAKTSNEQTFFGLRGNICYLPLSQLLSAYPPLRFSVEFFNLEMLKEKDRIHSRTVWYAGSLWNVYVQVYRSPGSGLIPNYQLGVYLHRQSPTENIPPFSAPDPFADVRWEGSARNIDNGIPSASVSNPYVGNSSPPSSVPTPSSIPAASQTTPSSTNASDPPFYAVINHKPTYSYCDPRQVVSVYFSINCASPSGSAQTRFRSAPDVFKPGQSWGWKSSGLLSGPQRDARNVSITDGNFEAALIQMDRESPPVGHEVSFRATVVLGVV
ncbi:hypothetical protein J3R30DRAFT_3283492 [Lentinula aciculospora]|uniref:BTB domain-containing protein n=1 Tax=Lentinula aciculospora TaxID=153920 RepID=A0A9W9DV17_9AGAR|nr:hypothetical protein J3R30DRAFT_3283492 [Lentinula aciculospora]